MPVSGPGLPHCCMTVPGPGLPHCCMTVSGPGLPHCCMTVSGPGLDLESHQSRAGSPALAVLTDGDKRLEECRACDTSERDTPLVFVSEESREGSVERDARYGQTRFESTTP